jgi:hypothetical protein
MRRVAGVVAVALADGRAEWLEQGGAAVDVAPSIPHSAMARRRHVSIARASRFDTFGVEPLSPP